jgi:sugar diacid utilization regulator
MAVSHQSSLVQSAEVFQWPEFKALAERLGVDMSKHIVRIAIFLDRDTPAEVCLEMFAEDCSSSQQWHP